MAVLFKRAGALSEFTPEQIQELGKCQADPVYFMKKYVKVQHPTKGTVPFELYDYQLEMVDVIHNHKDVALLCSRQLGKTTVVAMYILWMATFQEDKLCVIASKAMNHATEIMSRIKFAYEELPDWLRAGCKFYNRTSIEFDNGSRIKSEATSEKTGRGGSPSILFIDEIAFISRRIQDEMWSSIAPSLSTGGKFILTTTPNGDQDLFAQIWRGAMSGTNSFKPLLVLWDKHPERGPEYYADMAGKLGPVKVRQELDCEFLSSEALLINSIALNSMRSRPHLYENMGFKFWAEKLGGKDKMYLVGVDPATGNGSDFTSIEVFEFPSLEQVAELRLNTVNIPLIYSKIKWLLKHLRASHDGRGRSEVLWTFERNGIGEALVALIQNDDSRDGGVHLDGVELYTDDPKRIGIYTTGKTKILACLQLKTLIEKAKNGLKVNSETLLFELKDYIAKGGTYEAKAGSTDDCVSATLSVVRLIQRLAEYEDSARKMVYAEVDPDSDIVQDDYGNEPVPFLVF